MSRTTRDILIRDITIEKTKEAVVKWFNENKIKDMINTSDYVLGRLGSGFLTASKFFEVTLVPTEGGVIAKTEGWVTGVTALPKAAPIYLPEQEFSETVVSYGGIPRKEGMKAMKRLWNILEALSKNP